MTLEDSVADVTIEYLDGYRQGYKSGYETAYDDGLAAGWVRGREDILYQLKRYVQDTYDPDVERLLKEITGEDD